MSDPTHSVSLLGHYNDGIPKNPGLQRSIRRGGKPQKNKQNLVPKSV